MPVSVDYSLSLEALASRLAAKIAETPRDPMKPVRILVQSLGWKVWLSRRLASELGVSMNLKFDFPRDYVRELAKSVGEAPETWFAWEKDALEWRIHAMLPGLLGRPEFEPIARYLTNDAGGLLRVQLAQALAHHYDQYLLFRPDWIRAWEHGEQPVATDRWQGALWRELDDTPHKRTHFPAFLEKLKTGATRLPSDESPLFVFGLTGMPPAFHGVLDKLAEARPVLAFQNILSTDYLGDAGSRRIRARELRTGIATPEVEGLAHPLLVASGRQAAVTQALVLENGWVENDIATPSPEEAPDTLLNRLRREILENRTTAGELPPLVPDDSIRIHSCHNPMREVEVLHDELTHLLATIPDLRPRDIVVMAPNIEDYAPVIRAVFGRDKDVALRLPYGLADRPPVDEKPLFAHFAALLRLPTGRLTAPELMGLTDSPVTRAAIGLSEENRDIPAHWLREAHTTWGEDAEARARTGAPAFNEGSWRDFLSRLRLGLALESSGEQMFSGGALPYAHLPLDGLDGSRGALAGRLAERLEIWLDWVASSRAEKTPGAWLEHAAELLDAVVPNDDAGEDFVDDLRDLRRMMERLRRTIQISAHEAPMPYAAFLAAFEPHLAVSHQAGAFLTGGVTFCALKPLRAIPARVVALLGLDSGIFPRPARRDGFDLMSEYPKLGDTSRTDDDRHLFLETLLATRERLIITYLGRDSREDKPKPSATVVDELLESISPHLASQDKKQPFRGVLIPQAPFPYSGRYFSDEGRAAGLRTYRNACARGASALTREPGRPEPFAAEPLPETVSEEEREITFDSWKQFWTKPAEWFLSERLRLRFPREEESLPEDEFPDSDRSNLDDYARREFILSASRTTPPETLLAIARAKGVTTPGTPGELRLNEATEEAARLTAAAGQLGNVEPMTLVYSEVLSGHRLTLRFAGEKRGSSLTLMRCGKLRDSDRLHARWLAAWCGLLLPEDRRGLTQVAVVSQEKESAGVAIFPILGRAEAEEALQKGIRDWESAQSMPWPMPLNCGKNFAEAWMKHEGIPDADRCLRSWRDAMEAWKNFNGGESDNPANRLVYGEDFPNRANSVITPDFVLRITTLWNDVDAALLSDADAKSSKGASKKKTAF